MRKAALGLIVAGLAASGSAQTSQPVDRAYDFDLPTDRNYYVCHNAGETNTVSLVKSNGETGVLFKSFGNVIFYPAHTLQTKDQILYKIDALQIMVNFFIESPRIELRQYDDLTKVIRSAPCYGHAVSH